LVVRRHGDGVGQQGVVEPVLLARAHDPTCTLLAIDHYRPLAHRDGRGVATADLHTHPGGTIHHHRDLRRVDFVLSPSGTVRTFSCTVPRLSEPRVCQSPSSRKPNAVSPAMRRV